MQAICLACRPKPAASVPVCAPLGYKTIDNCFIKRLVPSQGSTPFQTSNKKLPDGSSFIGALDRSAYCRQSALLADPSLRLRYPSAHHSAIKQLTIVLLNASCLLKVRLLFKQATKNSLMGVLLLVRSTGVEPATTRRRRPVLYPLSYKHL